MTAQKPHKSSKTGLFLIELMIAIAFFSLASAICMQLFVKAHLVSASSGDLSMALNEAQWAAESFKTSDGTPQQLQTLLDAQASDDDTMIVYYDADWKKTAPPSNVHLVIKPKTTNEALPLTYVMTIDLRPDGALKSADITIKKVGADEPLYEVTASKYFA